MGFRSSPPAPRDQGAPPERIVAQFAAAIAAGNLAGAAACFTRDCCLLTPDSTAIRGREEIRSVLAQLIAARTRIHIDSGWFIGTEDVTVASQRWTIERPDGGAGKYARVTIAGICLRHLEDDWRISILAPWGWQPRAGEN